MNRKNLLISGFADEIDPSLNRQLEALQKMGIRYIEMRGVDGKSLVHCTDSELSVIHRKLDAAGVRLSSVGSPIGKIGIEDDFAPHWELFQRTVEIAQKLELDDEIISINGHKIHTANDLIYAFVDVGDQPVQMTVRRDGQKIELQDVPFAHEQVEGQTIVQLDFKVKGLEKTPLRVLKQSWYMTTGVVKQVWGSFGKLISGQYQLNQLSGPVGVTQMIGEVASARDYSSFFFMTAFITINIGVFNLLPLPALDVGRLLFLFIELLRGKPVPAKYEGFVHAAGLVLLMGLMLMVTFNDIVRLIKG